MKAQDVPGPRSVYLGEVYTQMQAQAKRLGRSTSWLIREACKQMLPKIAKWPKPPTS